MATMNGDIFCNLLSSNDPNTTEVKAEAGEYGYARIGEALRGNSHVTSIAIDLERVVNWSDVPYDGSADSAEEDRLVTIGAQRIGPVLQYVRESMVLRTVSLDDDKYEHDFFLGVWAKLAGFVFQAIWENHQLGGCIEDLFVQKWAYMESLPFTSFLQASKSLRRLTIPLHDDISNFEWFGSAIRSNESLEDVTLREENEQVEARTEVVCNIVLNLAHHRRIQTLDLGFSDVVTEVAAALALLLGTTTSLRSLKGGFIPEDLTAEDMEVIINGLRSNHGTLTELDLEEFPDDTIDAYVDYFKSTASPQNKLRILRYFNSNLEALSESMVIPNSIGSGLRVLKTWGNDQHDFIRFVTSLASQGSQNKLESLHISSLYEESAVVLCRCLPSLVHLAELHIEHYGAGDEVSHGFVKALKRNGSLHKVTVSPTLNNRYDRHVKAFGQRNQQVPVLLARPSSMDHQENAVAEPADDTTDMKLFPALFASALDTDRIAPNSLLIGLQSTAEDIGHLGTDETPLSSS